MVVSVTLFAATAVVMICGILFFPQIKLGKIKISTFWVVSLTGAILMLLCARPDYAAVWKSLTADRAVNPLKILTLFISMTVLSIFLDEAGFFRRLAYLVLKRAKTGQKKLFFCLYLTVSVLTVFTSNDIIILSFTPFICYFCKNADIDPVPYLAAEFVAANTWSMALIIGNPTNIYLTAANGTDFITYMKYSALPTVFAGTVSLCALYLMFRKKLSSPISGEAEEVVAEDKFLLWIGIAHLGVCTALLAVSAYIGWQMWLISLCSAVSLTLIAGVTYLARRQKPVRLLNCYKRAPWQLIPFVLSMFVMIAVLEQKGITQKAGDLLGSDFSVLKYGVTSFFASNVINNIPMSVFFASMAESACAGTGAVLATVIGSNLGACFTPIGALAGIMFGSILARQNVKFGYLRFLKTGILVALPALFAALGGLWISLKFF